MVVVAARARENYRPSPIAGRGTQEMPGRRNERKPLQNELVGKSLNTKRIFIETEERDRTARP